MNKKDKGISQEKAMHLLFNAEVRGRELTPKQKDFFKLRAGGEVKRTIIK